MKICICTTPLRPVPTVFPPFGSMAIIQSLRALGDDVAFFNIDYFRFRSEQVRSYFEAGQFDVVGISAVVSTAYAYTKSLTKLIRAVSPKTIIVVGGNLAASAEILLRKCNVDFCVVGDGEIVIKHLVNVLRKNPRHYTSLSATKGICYLDERGDFHFTGYGEKPSANDIEWPDYGILEEDGSLDYFVTPEINDGRFAGHEYELKGGERAATVVMAKGCVARCTFCHRWEKGFRARPADQIIDHVKMLRDRYNVNFVDVADENFGSDKKVTWDLAAQLGEMGVIWRCAGVRTHTVTKESLLHWRQNGCVAVCFGIESGSQKMLDVMEKRATIQDNINALRWVDEAGLGTVIQLVIGMPGEDDDTIRETIEFLQQVSPSLRYWRHGTPSETISINYAQALPGTPLYEWAREHGYIGRSIDEEEEYLMRISDTDAYAEDHFVNYTGYPLLKVITWRPWILAELDYFHMPVQERADVSFGKILQYYVNLVRVRLEKGWGQGNAFGRTMRWILVGKVKHLQTDEPRDYVSDSGYFNIKKGFKFAPLLLNPITRKYFHVLLAVAMAIAKGRTPFGTVRLLTEYLVWYVAGAKKDGPEIKATSLRKVVNIAPSSSGPSSTEAMIPLRLGR